MIPQSAISASAVRPAIGVCMAGTRRVIQSARCCLTPARRRPVARATFLQVTRRRGSSLAMDAWWTFTSSASASTLRSL
ncbi:hypothetical protein P73_0519 [Celeribacter indicus]|uniref:Uncharacterized protein n=1 Tax=Celeribacter indicus TaxID=1208324 RepID=A0A0B5DQ32_9RHOB|nr:hypothetical protein P73_0519 [Celeribacter indicus]